MTYLPPVQSPLSLSDLGRALTRSLTAGDGSEGFASTLAERFSADRVILTASGTEALELAIRTAGHRLRSPQAPVALPAYSCYDLVSAAVGSGQPFVFYDLDPTSLSPDPESLRRAVDLGARVIVVSSLYGYPIDWSAVKAFQESGEHVVVEDAAQGAAAAWNGREVGSLGDFSILSFGRGKGWTGGGGGALLLRGVEGTAVERGTLASVSVAESARRAFASVAQWVLARPPVYGLPARIPWLGLGETTYNEPIPPRHMPRFSARLAEATARASERASHARVERGFAIHRRLEAWARVDERVGTIRPVPGASPTYLRVPMVWRGHPTAALARRFRGFGVARAYPRILPRLEASTGSVGDGEAAFPGASLLARHLITLPSHAHVTDDIVETIIGLLRTSQS